MDSVIVEVSKTLDDKLSEGNFLESQRVFVDPTTECVGYRSRNFDGRPSYVINCFDTSQPRDLIFQYNMNMTEPPPCKKSLYPAARSILSHLALFYASSQTRDLPKTIEYERNRCSFDPETYNIVCDSHEYIRTHTILSVEFSHQHLAMCLHHNHRHDEIKIRNTVKKMAQKLLE